MAFEQVVDLDCAKTVVLGGRDKKTGKSNPTSAEGYFIGSKAVKNKLGDNFLHILQTPEGNLGVWGKTDLNAKFKAVVPGQMVRATFVGMVETKYQPMFKYKLEVDKANTIDVSSVETFTNFTDSDDRLFDDDNYLTSTDEVADEVAYVPPVAPKQAPKGPSAETIAKAKAMLGNRRV